MSGGTGAATSYNPMTPRSGGSYTTGATDVNGNTATTTQGVQGTMLTLRDSTSLIGKMAYQVPAALLNPTAAVSNTAQVTAAMGQQYQAASAAVQGIGGALGSLASSLPNFGSRNKDKAGDDDDGLSKRQQRRLAKDDDSPCKNGKCNGS